MVTVVEWAVMFFPFYFSKETTLRVDFLCDDDGVVNIVEQVQVQMIKISSYLFKCKFNVMNKKKG